MKLNALLCLLFATGCTQLPTPTTDTSPPPEPLKAVTEKPFEAETLYALMVAEMAVNQRQYRIGLSTYIDQAKRTKDPAIIERAFRLARFVNASDALFDLAILWQSVDSDQAEANAVIAQSLSYDGRVLEAIPYVKTLLATQDNPVTINLSAQSNNLTRAQRQELIEALLALQTQYPSYASIPTALSIAYRQQEQFKRAKTTVDRALSLDQRYTSAIMQKARLINDDKGYDAAIRYLDNQIDASPEDTQLRLMYARLLAKTDLDKAYAQFHILTKQAPTNLDLVFSKALVALELDKLDDARRLLSQLNNIGYRPQVLPLYEGQIYEKQARIPEAINAYRRITDGPEFIAAQQRAYYLEGNSGSLDQAQDHFNQLREQYPKRSTDLYKAESSVLMELEQVDLAIALLTKAINSGNRDTGILYNRAMAYERIDQLVAMERDFRAILATEPDNAATLNALGYLLADRTHRYEEALELVQRAIDIQPEEPAILDSLGWAYYKLGRFDEAIAVLSKAYELMKDAEVAAHLGAALWQNGQQDEASAVWNDFPEDEHVTSIQRELNARP